VRRAGILMDPRSNSQDPEQPFNRNELRTRDPDAQPHRNRNRALEIMDFRRSETSFTSVSANSARRVRVVTARYVNYVDGRCTSRTTHLVDTFRSRFDES